MLILIAGPYLSGTGNDPNLIAENMANLEAMALPLLRKGHIPLIGEWVANPIMRLAGSKKPGDEIFHEFQYPIAHGLLQKCDAVLRIRGASTGADLDVQKAQALGIKVYFDLDQVPTIA